MERRPDAELIALSQQGDLQAFAALVERYQQRVYTLAVRLLGDREESRDVAQEVFLKVYHGLAGFRLGQKFTPWLFTITAHTARDHWRKQRGEAEHTLRLPEGTELVSPSPTPDCLWEARETWQAVAREVARLPWDYRTVITLRHFQDLSYAEIARVLELPVNTVKTRLRRGRLLLKERLAPLLEQRGQRN